MTVLALLGLKQDPNLPEVPQDVAGRVAAFREFATAFNNMLASASAQSSRSIITRQDSFNHSLRSFQTSHSSDSGDDASPPSPSPAPSQTSHPKNTYLVKQCADGPTSEPVSSPQNVYPTPASLVAEDYLSSQSTHSPSIASPFTPVQPQLLKALHSTFARITGQLSKSGKGM